MLVRLCTSAWWWWWWLVVVWKLSCETSLLLRLGNKYWINWSCVCVFSFFLCTRLQLLEHCFVLFKLWVKSKTLDRVWLMSFEVGILLIFCRVNLCWSGWNFVSLNLYFKLGFVRVRATAQGCATVQGFAQTWDLLHVGCEFLLN